MYQMGQLTVAATMGGATQNYLQSGFFILKNIPDHQLINQCCSFWTTTTATFPLSFTSFVDNHIHMVSLPPHTSHRLQPLDLTFFGPLKNSVSREYHLFMIRSGHKRITEYELAELLKNVFLKLLHCQMPYQAFVQLAFTPTTPTSFLNLILLHLDN